MRREFRWIGLAVVASAILAAFGCEETVTRPSPPPDPKQISIKAAAGLPSPEVYDIHIDNAGQVWMATNAGVWLRSATGDTVRTFDDFDGIPNRQTRAIAELNGKVYVGTWGGGLGVYDGTSWTTLNKINGLVSNSVFSITVDDSSAWIGTVDGVSQYIDDASRPMAQRWVQHSGRLSNSRVVQAITIPPLLQTNPVRGPEVWMGTQGDGIVSLRIPPMYAMYGFDTPTEGLRVFASGSGGTVMLFQGSTGRWTSQATGTRSQLAGLWGTGPNALHAVGDNGTALFYNGTTWSSRNSRTTEHLNAIWGTSNNNIWAVGNTGTAIQYNGTAWILRTTPTKENLVAVWGASPTQVYAVSDRGTVLQSNGSVWRVADVPETQGTTMYGMWGASDNAMFSVGMNGTILARTSTVPRDEGGSGWSLMQSPTTQHLRGVFGSSAGRVFAVGDNGTALTFNGGTWSSLPSLPPDLQLQAVWARNATDIFVVGQLSTYANTSDRFYRMTGGAWNPVSRGANVFRQVVQYRTAQTGMPGDNVTQIAYDPNSDLFWVSLEDFGLASVDVDGAVWNSYSTANGLVSTIGFSVAVNSVGDIWFGSQEGASCILGGSGAITNYVQGSGMPGVRVRKVYVAPNVAPTAPNSVWMSFIDSGAGSVVSNQR